MNTDQNQDMDLSNSSSLPSSRTSTPVLTECDRLQIAQDEIKKFSILLSNVSHTLNAIESCVQEDDPELTHLYSRQEYLYERRQAAVSEFSTLPRCTTPGCQIHNSSNNNNPKLNFSPVNSPSKKSIEFPELPKINRPKRKESEDGFTSPTYRQTFKKANLEIKNFTVDASNKFKNLTVDGLIRPNVSYAQAANNTNSKNTQQMATLTKKTPIVSQPKQINQVVTPAIPTPAPEDNSPQALILKTLQATIQSLTVLTQQVAALSFPTPPPQPKKNKSKLTKAQLQALLEAYLDNDDE
ncbi:hypothetical protein TNIN_386891 [Trichonephila inaurata madagascariensis]|uniref:Uncharacterized protein n=1 Tax=Trichonephila inaurata madagascariensis TaxID=2747483 RepID=A0A8X6IJN6_9ARAC|nr:hypothetical protein TNIN_386891 [Trichonephila inaurata madagascariensis]